MANTAGQWHALIDCYDQHRRPVWKSSQGPTFFDGESGMLFGATLWEYYAEYYKTRDNPNVSG